VHRGGAQGLLKRIVTSPEFAEEIGLSEDQAETLKADMYELKLREIDLRAELEKSALEQARLMTENTVDEAALMKAVEKTGAVRTEIAKQRVQELLTVKKILTVKQLKKARKILQPRMRKGQRVRRVRAKDEFKRRKEKLKKENERKAEDWRGKKKKVEDEQDGGME